MSKRFLEPVTLTGRNWATLEPMQPGHEDELLQAAKDGELWKLWYTSVADAGAVLNYMALAMKMREEQGALPFVVRRNSDGLLTGLDRRLDERHLVGRAGRSRANLRELKPERLRGSLGALV